MCHLVSVVTLSDLEWHNLKKSLYSFIVKEERLVLWGMTRSRYLFYFEPIYSRTDLSYHRELTVWGSWFPIWIGIQIYLYSMQENKQSLDQLLADNTQGATRTVRHSRLQAVPLRIHFHWTIFFCCGPEWIADTLMHLWYAAYNRLLKLSPIEREILSWLKYEVENCMQELWTCCWKKREL